MTTEAPPSARTDRRGTARVRTPAAPQRRWLVVVGIGVALALVGLAVLALSPRDQVLAEAPEAQRVLDVQAGMPFQILTPAYLPGDFDRANVDIKIDQAGPSGEPMAQLAYRTRRGAAVFVREWVPGNPDSEVLASSKPIQTKWGKGWLLSTNQGLSAVWVDVGPLRASIYTQSPNIVSREQLVQIADTLGPVSGRQVFTFIVDRPAIKDVPPPLPFEVKTNAQGVQEFTLVITPGGYNPLRFAVKKGVPVKMTFRQLGQVGCGNTLMFPANPASPSSLILASESDVQVLEFTPQQAGEFMFRCGHDMYRGVMVVRE